MKIKGFVETSMVDWDGKISAVVFTPGCNFRCPFCQNRELVLNPDNFEDIPEKHIFSYLEEHKDFVDGVCITGGEPTLQPDLGEFCRKLHDAGVLAKLDTNGASPEVLQKLVDEKLVDYVSLDIKGPFGNYKKFVGVDFEVEKVKQSVQILLDSTIDYEFRTTVVPTLHTEKTIEKTAEQIKGAKLYVLQKFRPVHCLDEKFNSLKTQTDEKMEKLAGVARKQLRNVKWRGK